MAGTLARHARLGRAKRRHDEQALSAVVCSMRDMLVFDRWETSVCACVPRCVARTRYLYAFSHQVIIATQGVDRSGTMLPCSLVLPRCRRCYASSLSAG